MTQQEIDRLVDEATGSPRHGNAARSHLEGSRVLPDQVDHGHGIKIGEYTIDHDGTNGRWRATWIRPDRYGAERLFDAQQQAEYWAWEMVAIEDAVIEGAE